MKAIRKVKFREWGVWGMINGLIGLMFVPLYDGAVEHNGEVHPLLVDGILPLLRGPILRYGQNFRRLC